MRIFSNLKAISLIMVLACAGFFYLISTKPHKVVEELPPVAAETTSSTNFMEEAEKRREQMLEEKSAVERHEKLLKAKENSVECKFWKQQKSVSSDAKVDEKIIEFCTLSSASSLGSSTATVDSETASSTNGTSSPEDVSATMEQPVQ